jgi:hypothetical protein
MCLDLPWVTATVSAGLSAAERAPPGWFAIGAGSFGGADSGIDLLAAAASSWYLELGGGDDPGGIEAGVRLRLAGHSGRLVARYVLSVDLPGFVPGPCLSTGDDIDIAFERRWTPGAGTLVAGLTASNRIETDADGRRLDDPSGRVSVGWDGDRIAADLALDVDRDVGVSLEGSMGTGEAFERVSAALEAGCAFRRDAPSLSICLEAGLELVSGKATVRVGIDDAPLARGGLRDTRPWISLGWGVSAPDEPSPAGEPP